MTERYATVRYRKTGEQAYTDIITRLAEYAVRDFDGNDIRTEYAKASVTTDGSVKRLGTENVGSGTQPVRIVGGYPTPCDSTFLHSNRATSVTGAYEFTAPVKVAEPTGSGQAVPTNGEGMVASKYYLQVGTVTASDTDDLSVTFSKGIGTVVSVTLTTGTGNSAVTIPLYVCWKISGTTVTLKGMGGVTGTVKVYCI